MKYTIEGFQQQKLIEYGLDDKDAVILRYIVDYRDTGELTTVSSNGKSYFWIKYQGIIDNLPILRINSRDVISRRFDKYIECGLMEKYLSKSGGVYTCFRFVEEKYRPLIDYKYEGVDSKVDTPTQKSGGVNFEVDTPVDSKVDTKDSSKRINTSKKYDEDGKSQTLQTLFDEQSKESSSVFEILKTYGITESQIESAKAKLLLNNHNPEKFIGDKIKQFQWLEKYRPEKITRYKNKTAALFKSIIDDWVDQEYIKNKNKPPAPTKAEMLLERDYLKAVRILEFYKDKTEIDIELTDEIQKLISKCCLDSNEIEFVISEFIENKQPFNLIDLLKYPELKKLYNDLKIQGLNEFKNKLIEQNKIKVG